MTHWLDKEMRLPVRTIKRLRLLRGRMVMGLLWVIRKLAKRAPLRTKYLKLLSRLVRRTDLFDEPYYAEVNNDVVDTGVNPLRHYVAYGDREGRLPIPFFDPGFYREHAAGRSKRVNALLHYYFVGRFAGISPSAWFDVSYYLSQNKDVDRSGVDPLCHYLYDGWLQGRSPSPQFDGDYYLRTNPDVREAHINPLIHYLRYGRLEGRCALPGTDDGLEVPPPEVEYKKITEEDWAYLNPREAVGDVKIDVVVPVYRDRDITLRCLYQLLVSDSETPFEAVVVDDCSPDADLADDLKRLATRGLITLLRNKKNLGFVCSANRGMALHPERDVVLLNSDAEVYGDWLDRLHAAAYRHSRVATVTPLSNNATICSYPRFLHDNPYSLEVDYPVLDQMAARANAGVDVDAPTGVGFCMYLRRDSLNELGYFDEKAFGRGYGEENDFCQLAIAEGWRNTIAADVFVRHIGGMSFRGEKAQRVADALKVLAKRYPDYERDVHAFIKRDPLAEARERLDWGRLKAKILNENVLIACHNRGGGSERHVAEDTELLQRQGKNVFYLRPEHGKPTHVRLGHPDCVLLLNLPAYDLADTEGLAGVFRELGITCIHSHGLVDFVAEAPTYLLAAAKSLNVPLHVDVHDYKIICPRFNLADQHGHYCGEPGEKECDECLVSRGNDFNVHSIRDWRESHHRVLKEVENVWVPDLDVRERLSRYFPDIDFRVSPHEELDLETVDPREPELGPSDSLRIVVPGAISKIKGYEVLLACAREAQRKRLPLEFVVLGFSQNDGLLEKAGVHVTGRYLDREALDKLHALSPHLIWLPSIWPETYSYTLSLSLQAGYPVFAFDIGAIGRRLRQLEKSSFLWPLDTAHAPSQINRRFLDYRRLRSLQHRRQYASMN